MKLSIPKHSDLIYDVGLHRGEDTDFYLNKGFRVVAVEADPDHAEFCRQRFRRELGQGRLVIVNGAIVEPEAAGSGKKIQFHKSEGESVWGTVRTDWASRNLNLGSKSRLIEVDAISFAAVLGKHGIPHYLKVDIEGCDLLCLQALVGFTERPNYVSIESDKTSLANIRREIQLLSELGYNAFKAVEQSSVPDSSPPSPPREGRDIAYRFVDGSSGLFGAELSREWLSEREVLRAYRRIMVGYRLLGENGALTHWRFRGAGRLRSAVAGVLSRLTRNHVPGWYDTHARHSSFENATLP